MENLKKEIEEWTGRRRDTNTIPSPWPLVEGDYDFEQVIGKAKKSPDFFGILRACVLWEYAREMPTMRTLDAKWSELKISGMRLPRFSGH